MIKKQNTTRKKVKAVGKRTYYQFDESTKTMTPVEFGVVEVEDRDANFNKIWLATLISSLTDIANSKLKVVFWLIENRTKENYIIAKAKDIASSSGVSIETVKSTLRILKAADFIKMIGNGGAYQINPDIIFKGGTNDRCDLLISYKSLHDNEETQKQQLQLKTPQNNTKIIA